MAPVILGLTTGGCMIGQSVPLGSLDEAFVKILIEELTQQDQIADLGDDLSPGRPDSAAHGFETIADVPFSTSQDAGLILNGGIRSGAQPLGLPAENALLPGDDRPKHWHLLIRYQDGRRCTLPLEDKPIRIGRSRSNDLVLTCGRVSREHARISLDERGPRVDDLASRNGVLVNGIRVPAAYLKPRDIVRVGSVEIEFEVVA